MAVILVILLVVSGVSLLFDVSFWGALLILGVPFGIIIFFLERSVKKDEEAKKEKERQYNDPGWRRTHPKEAREYELQKQEKEREAHRRKFGPAVRIDQITGGHWDHIGYAGWSPWPDSAGGWDVKCNISNVGSRQISSVTIVFAALDANGNKCFCATHGYTDAKCTYTGPLASDRMAKDVIFSHLWYNVPIASISVESIHVAFSDGTSQNISKNGSVVNH